MERIPPATTVRHTTTTTATGPDPGRQAGGDPDGQRGAVQLRDDVQPAHDHHHQARDAADGPGIQPGLGEVRNRVGAGAPQRGRHEQQQHQVAGGVAHGIPQGIRAGEQDQPGDAQEARGGQVLAADRRGIPPGPDRAGGHVEVPGGAGDPQPVEADDGRGHRDGGEWRRCRRPGSPASSLVPGEVPVAGLVRVPRCGCTARR